MGYRRHPDGEQRLMVGFRPAKMRHKELIHGLTNDLREAVINRTSKLWENPAD